MFLLNDGPSLGLNDLPPEIAAPGVAGAVTGAERSSASRGSLEASGREVIRETIETCHGNLTLVAKHLGIAKSTLYTKLKKHGLDQVVNKVRGPAR
jgi:transcriptional regulator of acetoin/glycerol metabolism